MTRASSVTVLGAIALCVVVTSLGFAPPARAETPCDDCWNDKCPDLKGIVPKCKATTTPKPPKDPKPKVDDKPAACPVGKERNADTAGHCCWPGQAWNGARCVGVPSSCPSTHTIDVEHETCDLPKCREGQQRAFDGVHCCWPGQAWSSAQQMCLGQPQCASGWALEDGACISPAEIKRRADEAAKSAADAAERARLEEAERVRRAQEEEAARLKREQEQREAIERANAEAAAREEAERRAREEEEARRAEEARKAEEYLAAKNSAQLQRNVAFLVGGASFVVTGLGGLAALGGVVTNAEIASGKLEDGDAIQETADRGQLFNALSWTGIVGGGLGVVGAIVWHTLSGDPEPPS